MAGNANFDDIITTTLRNRSERLADAVSNNNALLMYLKRRGNVKTVSGGRTIVHELDYAENSSFTRYSGYETLSIQPSATFTAAEYSWKQAAVAVTMSGLEMLQNSGEDAIIDLMESRIVNAERTMANNLASDVYSAGTADGGKQIGGLQLLVPDDPTTGTAGGIDRSAAGNTFWRSQVLDASSHLGTAPTSSTILSAMNMLYTRCSRGNDKPDLIVADNNYFNLYLNSLQANQRYTNEKTASAGFANLQFWGGAADVVLDGGIDGGCPANHMYFINTRYLFLRPHRDRNMVPLNPDRFATNQDALVKLIAFAGNLCSSNLQLQGVLKA